jgi:hypothetical protein
MLISDVNKLYRIRLVDQTVSLKQSKKNKKSISKRFVLGIVFSYLLYK